MTRNILKLLFFVSRTRINKRGLVPIICRITYKGKRKRFSTGLFIRPNEWYSELQKAKPPNSENDFINKELSLIRTNINKAFLFLQVQEIDFNVMDIYKQFIGEDLTQSMTLLEMFDFYTQRQKKLIGIETSEASIKRILKTREYVELFINFYYKKKDYELKQLKLSFMNDFEYYLKTERNLHQNTVYKHVQRIRQVIRLAISQEYLDNDPFILYKNRKIKKEVVFLTNEELERLEKHTFTIKRVERIRDMFVLCCYTGLAFKEMNLLEHKHIIKGFDGNLWIQMKRNKTQKTFSVPLLPKALAILDKYRGCDEKYLLPRISNQKFNSYLKEIAAIVGIGKNLTHHIARKTFATTVLLYNDIPMEIVSELLGHSKITITQEHYGKVVKKKISEHIIKLSEKLDKKKKGG